jgi:hypothetical protein
LRRVVNVKPRTSQVNPSTALVSWWGALPPGNAVCGERKHDLFFVELGYVLGLTMDQATVLPPHGTWSASQCPNPHVPLVEARTELAPDDSIPHSRNAFAV